MFRRLERRSGARVRVGWAALALLWTVAGCTALPTIVPDMARRPVREVHLEGVHGPLSARQAREVLDRLARRGEQTSIFDRHLALEEAVAGTPLMVGNRVALLQDGPATFQAMVAAIRAAKNHVHMETYIIEDDEVGNRFADILIGKQAEGVQVTLLYDSVGSMNTSKAFFQRLRDGGVRTLEFNPVNPLVARKGWEVNQRDHRKLLIVDGRIAFLGGINISSVYSGGSFASRTRQRPGGGLPWRDIHLMVEGPIVAEFQKLFLASWAKQKGEVLATTEAFPQLASRGKEVVRAIGSSPDEPFSLIYATLLSAIGSAETSVYLTNAYFVPDPQLLAALKAAVARGVDVKLILPGQTDSRLVFHAGRSYYTELLTAGVKIYERRDALLHSKTAVIDGVWATVGSTNLDWRSFLHNDEVNAVILGHEFGAQMQALFEGDLAASTRILPDRWERRGLGDRFMESISRLWGYWL
jgi:cardiolipin synthase